MATSTVIRTDIAKRAFYGGNLALWGHLVYLKSYQQDGVTWAANGLTLAECIELVNQMTDDDLALFSVWDYAPCLCGAPMYDGRCSEEDCVCSTEVQS